MATISSTFPIVLPIRPKWTEKIFSGEKNIELRRKVLKYFPNNPNLILIYETAPTSKFVGIAELKTIASFELPVTEGDRSRIKKEFGFNDCVPQDEFEKYFKGLDKGYFYMLGEVFKFKDPLSFEKFGLVAHPQATMESKKTTEEIMKIVLDQLTDPNSFKFCGLCAAVLKDDDKDLIGDFIQAPVVSYETLNNVCSKCFEKHYL